MAAKTAATRERIGRVGQRRQVVIPREMLETLKLQAGDFVAFAEQKNGVLIKPKRMIDSDDTLTPAEAKIVRRGEAQLKRGESKTWRVVKHALFRVELSRGAQSSFCGSHATYGNGSNAPSMSLKRRTTLGGATAR